MTFRQIKYHLTDGYKGRCALGYYCDYLEVSEWDKELYVGSAINRARRNQGLTSLPCEVITDIWTTNDYGTKERLNDLLQEWDIPFRVTEDGMWENVNTEALVSSC